MQGKNVMLDRHKIEHNSENALLHFTSIFSTEDNHLLCFKVDSDTGTGSHSGSIPVCRECTTIVNCEIRTAISLHLLFRGTDKHISHEKTMIGSSAYNTNLNPITRIPPSVPIKNVNSSASIEIINCPLTSNLPNCFGHGFIYRTPPDILGGRGFVDDTLVYTSVANRGMVYLEENDRFYYQRKLPMRLQK
jgi:hypothetical protein